MGRFAARNAPTDLSIASRRSATARFAGGVTRTLCIGLLFFVSSAAWAQPAMVPTQAGNTKNQQVAVLAGASVVTLTGGLHTRGHLYSLDAFCSAGTATLTITDGGTQIWSSVSGAVGTSVFTKAWNPSLTGTISANLVVTLGTCGGGNTGTLSVQADVF